MHRDIGARSLFDPAGGMVPTHAQAEEFLRYRAVEERHGKRNSTRICVGMSVMDLFRIYSACFWNWCCGLFLLSVKHHNMFRCLWSYMVSLSLFITLSFLLTHSLYLSLSLSFFLSLNPSQRCRHRLSPDARGSESRRAVSQLLADAASARGRRHTAAAQTGRRRGATDGAGS
jgi:hypothetical protein